MSRTGFRRSLSTVKFLVPVLFVASGRRSLDVGWRRETHRRICTPQEGGCPRRNPKTGSIRPITLALRQ